MLVAVLVNMPRASVLIGVMAIMPAKAARMMYTMPCVRARFRSRVRARSIHWCLLAMLVIVIGACAKVPDCEGSHTSKVRVALFEKSQDQVQALAQGITWAENKQGQRF